MYFRKDITIQNPNGAALPGAEVFVCTQPANVDVFPPTPLAMTWSDPLGYNGPQQAPLVADGTGRAFYYAEPDFYTEVFFYRRRMQLVLPDQAVGGLGGGEIPADLMVNSIFIGGGQIFTLCADATPAELKGPVPYTFAVESSDMFGQPQPGEVIHCFKTTSAGVSIPVGRATCSPAGRWTFSSPGFNLEPGESVVFTRST